MLATADASEMAFPDRVRLPMTFDADRMADDLAAVVDAGWIEHFVTQNFDGDWSVIPLRICKGTGDKHPVMQIYSDPTATEFEDGPLMTRTPYLREVLASFDCEVQVARLMKLAAGSEIKEHSDNELGAEFGFARIHVPIVTNPEVDFRLNGERVVMEAGSAWYLRLSDPHRVDNRGATDRVHLVIDCRMNDWLRDRLAA